MRQRLTIRIDPTLVKLLTTFLQGVSVSRAAPGFASRAVAGHASLETPGLKLGQTVTSPALAAAGITIIILDKRTSARALTDPNDPGAARACEHCRSPGSRLRPGRRKNRP